MFLVTLNFDRIEKLFSCEFIIIVVNHMDKNLTHLDENVIKFAFKACNILTHTRIFCISRTHIPLSLCVIIKIMHYEIIKIKKIPCLDGKKDELIFDVTFKHLITHFRVLFVCASILKRK